MTRTAPLDELRLHLPDDPRPRPGGEFVLYWMQTTHRAHDNFALDWAVERANELGLPVLVYHGLRRDYPWANDRFHTFVLEAVVDLQADFEARGIQYAFWLDQGAGPGAEWPAGGRGYDPLAPAQAAPARAAAAEAPRERSALVALADRAALVVTDYFPTFIVPRQVRGLRRRTATPVVAVDSCTVVPLRWHEKEHSTARGIRPHLERALEHYLWPVANPEPRVRRPVSLPFDPVRVTPEGIAALVAGCDVDHAVPPSPVIRGGTAAGRARLGEFVRRGLARYADHRNDPNDLEAVSRLSPWLHFGNLSIHEVLLAARAAEPGAAYAKFQDEAVTWRELAHNFCFFNPRHRTVEGIPGWAREQLAAHEADPRPARYTLEELEQGRTADELWNAAQRSYRRDGWMHNYMRMLWGKTVLQWTRDAGECLRVLEHLNNRYSLDGRDPNTYGGIMWTFGKFDRPFYRRPIYGTVRYQSTRAARDKFDVPRYIRSYPAEG